MNPPSPSGYAPLETPTTEPPPSSTAESSALLPPFSSSPSSASPSHSAATAEHVDVLFKRWTSVVAQRMRLQKGKGKERASDADDEEVVLNREQEVEVWRSVFDKWEQEEGEGNVSVGELAERRRTRPVGEDFEMDHERFLGLVEQVRLAIAAGVHPRLNSKGSSGSYFAQNIERRTLAIFKPADEEPYGHLNPKFTKWLHRNFFAAVIPFGRSCLMPGQSYISEAAASVLDRELGTNIVPRTEVVALSSPAFYYDWIDLERAARRNGQLREKDGSFQVFLKGFTDASDFLSKHPYPGRPIRSKPSPSPAHLPRKRRHRRRNCFAPLLCICGRAKAEKEFDEEAGGKEYDVSEGEGDRFEWTEEVVESFREELEKLVVLDYLIRNTDRGLDNFMLRVCTSCDPPPAAYSAPSTSTSPSTPSSSSSATLPPAHKIHLALAAIDNSLAFPHKHPDSWRRYPYGWLDLPLSLIGRPWSSATRERYGPKLSDPTWWSRLKVEMRREFVRDKGFREEWWERQWALVKGQGLNLAESLRSDDEGPLELCRRPKKLVCDELVLVSPSKSLSDPPSSDLPSFGHIVDNLSTVATSATTRPPLLEHTSAPAATPSTSSASPARPPPPSASSSRTALLHRRTRSDYSTFSSLYSVPSSPSSRRLTDSPRTYAKTTRSPSVAAPLAGAPSTSSAAHLRKPLDSLSASLSVGHSAISTAELEEAERDAAEGEVIEEEDDEETGVGLMRRLDRVEEVERKRLKNARKDEAARVALDSGLEEASRSLPTSPSPFPFRRSSTSTSFSPSRPRTGNWGRRIFHRSASEEHAQGGRGRDDERRGLLTPPGEEDVSETGEDQAEDAQKRASQSAIETEEGRVSMSWHGASAVDARAAIGSAGGREPEGRGKRRWVVVERIEHVKEPKRRWWTWGAF